MTRPLLIGVITLLCGTALHAQSHILSGTVVDESGAAVPNATVVLNGPDTRETERTNQRGEYRFQAAVPGVYRLVVSSVGFSPASQDVTVDVADLALPPTRLSVASMNETIVVSAARLETRLGDAPVTMTVFDERALDLTPAQNVGDLLRSVPGMNVIQTSARDINLATRTATSTLATSQLALLDGRSIYLDFFGLILWDFVQNNADDIKQIEVVRGPASAVWGPNALTGVVNIITKSPRESAGTTAVFSAGAIDRNVGSTAGRSPGRILNASFSTSQIVNDRWSYRVSAGEFQADPYPRPVGTIPVVADPRAGDLPPVGGAAYPADARGALGSAFQNRGTSQPKVDIRVDQDLPRARLTYAGGVAGTSGTIYTGIGPFDIQPGSVMAYAKVNYSSGALKWGLFTNIVDAQAPSLLLPDVQTGNPLQLNFRTQTYDAEIGHAKTLGRHHALSYGANYRRNNFDITLAPGAKNRNELGTYIQDDIATGRFRFWLGTRVDKFGNLPTMMVSPRLAATFRVSRDHSIRASLNRAYRSPSAINKYLDVTLVNQVDLSKAAPLLPPALRPLVSAPFPLVVHGVGSDLPIGIAPQTPLKPTSLTAWEFAYTGTIRLNTTLGASVYVNNLSDQVNFVQLPASADPYTATNPPPGWVLPPAILTALAQGGIYLPRTAYTYLNLGPLREKGVELSIDHRFNRTLQVFANYSWQAKPKILAAADQFPVTELALPPTNRFNLGGTYSGSRYLGSLMVSYTDAALWTDVLTSAYHGFTPAYTLTNGMFGIKWRDGRITTSIKSTNMLNVTIQQHVFGDLLRRSVVGEVKLRM